jgi:hypothetical protein
LFCVACDQKALIQRMTPAADDKVAREFIEHIRSGHLDKAKAMLDTPLQSAEGENGMAQLFIMFKQGEVRSIQVVGVHWYGNAGGDSRVDLGYELELSTGWFAGSVVIAHDPVRGPLIQGAHFSPEPDSMERTNAFTFAGKDLRHYAMLGVCVMVPLVILGSLVVCVRSRVPLKWLWIIGILWGFGALHLNWATGQFSFQLLSFRLLGVSCFAAGPSAPWILSVSFPAAAVVFLCVRKKLEASISSTPPPLPQP